MTKKGKFITFLLITFSLLAIYVGGRVFIFYKIEKLIEKKLAGLEKKDIYVRYDYLDVASWKNKIELKGITVTVISQKKQDTTIKAQIKGIAIEGISFLQLIFDRELSVRSLYILSPHVYTYGEYHHKTEEEMEEEKLFFKKFHIGNLFVKDALWSKNDEDSLLVRVDGINLSKISVSNILEEKIVWDFSGADVSLLALTLPKDFYTIRVKSVLFNQYKKQFAIDSISFVPFYDKLTFAQKSKKQIDRITAVVPFFKMEGFESESTPFLKLKAKTVSMSFNVEAYRDKRFPLGPKKDIKSLPIEFMQKLPVVVQADLVRVIDSYVSYEEYPKEGTSSGMVFFEGLKADLHDVSNVQNAKPATMQASARFMGQGKISADFSFPVTPEGPYYVKGVLSDFSLPKINSLLESGAHTRIESGKLHFLKFQFQYDNTLAKGNLDLNYNDLKIISLAKHGNGKKAEFKTFLVNTFLENDKDNHVDKDKKNGDIFYHRDNHVSIFNYWVKSLFSGIKSVYHLDKLENKKLVAKKND